MKHALHCDNNLQTHIDDGWKELVHCYRKKAIPFSLTTRLHDICLVNKATSNGCCKHFRTCMILSHKTGQYV